MSRAKPLRATVILTWVAAEHQGILVHADRYQNTWILPGGRIETYQNGQRELPMAAAIRELNEETGLSAKEVKFLFTQEGGYYQHHVFAVQATGRLNKIIDRKEAPAFAVCGPDLQPHVFLCEPGYVTDPLVLSWSTKAILQRAYAMGAPPASTPTRKPAAAQGAPMARTATPQPASPPQPASATIVADEPDLLLRVAVGSSILELTPGDIVTQAVDAVVNAANDRLANGSGVSGAIHRAAGVAELDAACARLGGCPTGEARITSGFKLQARHIIHAVGPIYNEDRKAQADQLLVSAYRSSLELATAHNLRSIAFPSLSTGIYGFPVERAAPLAVQTILTYLQQHQNLALVRLVLWKDNLPIYSRALKQLLRAG